MSRTVPIPPFWSRLRAIMAYPFRGAAGITLLVLVLAMMLLGWFPVVGFLAVIICWLAAYKYAFEILQETAHGRLEAPERVLQVEDSVVLHYLGLQIVLLGVPLLVGMRAPGIGLGLLIASALVQPVATMVLAMTGSIVPALSVPRWLAVIARIGWAYAALVALLFVIQISASNATELLARALPVLLAQPLAIAFTLWGLFATFHLMGYLIYQYHRELDFEPEAVVGLPGLPPDRDQTLLDAAAERIRAGEAEAARSLMAEEIASRAVSAEVHELYRRLLQQADDRAERLRHGRVFLHLLLLEKQERRALALARECLDLDPDFTTPQPEDAAGLSERAAALGQRGLATDLLRAAIRAAPKHPSMPAWTLRAADLLLLQAGSEDEVRVLLERARERADEADRERIDQRLSALR